MLRLVGSSLVTNITFLSLLSFRVSVFRYTLVVLLIEGDVVHDLFVERDCLSAWRLWPGSSKRCFLNVC